MRWNWVEYGTVWGSWSDWVSATPGGSASATSTAPAAEPQSVGPTTNLTASADEQESGTVRLTWSEAENAQVHFVVYVKSAELSAGNYGSARMTPFAGSQGVVRGLEGGTSYSFIVIGMRWNWAEYGTVWGSWSDWTTEVPVDRTVDTIVFGYPDWDSVRIQTRIAQYIVEKGYGYHTNAMDEITAPLISALRRGDVDVLMELWLPRQQEAWNEAQHDGSALSLGVSLGHHWQSTFVIPAYLQRQLPDLDSVEDLKLPQYKSLFATATTGGKARLVSCVRGWECEIDNAAQVEGYGLSNHVEIFNPASGPALDADLLDAYSNREPWLGFLGALPNLERISLQENRFTGEIPVGLGYLSKLTHLDLSHNELTGEVPTSLGGLADLVRLDISNNELEGTIPTDLGNLRYLTILDLDNNQFTGEVPARLGNLANLTHLDLSNNELGGPLPVWLGHLAELTFLDLDHNQFTGQIPRVLGNLTKLEYLELDHNLLTGQIPFELTSLTNLERLELSSNAFTGCLPAGLLRVPENDLDELNLPTC